MHWRPTCRRVKLRNKTLEAETAHLTRYFFCCTYSQKVVGEGEQNIFYLHKTMTEGGVSQKLKHVYVYITT